MGKLPKTRVPRRTATAEKLFARQVRVVGFDSAPALTGRRYAVTLSQVGYGLDMWSENKIRIEVAPKTFDALFEQERRGDMACYELVLTKVKR